MTLSAKHSTLKIAVCCREWPVYPFAPWGRCGYCGTVPVLDPRISLAAYLAKRIGT
jgi:hypothetical protein